MKAIKAKKYAKQVIDKHFPEPLHYSYITKLIEKSFKMGWNAGQREVYNSYNPNAEQ